MLRFGMPSKPVLQGAVEQAIHEFFNCLELSLEPDFHPAPQINQAAGDRRTPAAAPGHIFVAIQQQADACCMYGVTHDVKQTIDVLRCAEPHRHMENFFSQLVGSFHIFD